MRQSGLLFLVLFSTNSFAGNLCDAGCSLTITFPSGGAIEATEPLVLTFGDGGIVDSVSTVTAYIEGETLTLSAGEALNFEPGGSFNLGSSGNIDYTHLQFSGGNIDLSTSGGSETILISGGSTLAILDAASLNIASPVDGNGTLSVGEGRV